MAKEKCRIPNCKNEVKSRGVCATHYMRWLKGKDAVMRTHVENHMLPSLRARCRSEGEASPSAAEQPPEDVERLLEDQAEERRHDGKIDRAEKRSQELADARIAAVSEFASMMGVKHVPHQGGLLFLGGDKYVYITPLGTLREANLTLAPKG